MTNSIKCLALLAGLVAAPFVAGHNAPAQAMQSDWCAVYRGGSENCGFYTQAQCAASVSGLGGFCRMSGYGGEPTQRRR
jgi:hypothetical protein